MRKKHEERNTPVKADNEQGKEQATVRRTIPFSHHEYDDDIGNFWVVIHPRQFSEICEDDIGEIVFETDVLGMARQFRGGLNEEDVLLITKNKQKALELGKISIISEMAKRMITRRNVTNIHQLHN